MRPVLWHIPVSHYSEKVRWALELKDVDHERRAPLPPSHMAIALWLTRGSEKTFPILSIDGRQVGDSTAIIGALEELYPEFPLYPTDPAEREHALELEDYFDESLGPQIRLLAWHELSKDHERMENFAAGTLPKPFGAAKGLARRGASAYVGLRFGVHDDERANQARRRVLAALDRLETELGGRGYLVGDSLTVADLTAASLFYPLVLPPEAPRAISDPPVGFEAFRAPLKERRGYRWVAEMFARHRNRVAAPTPA